MLVVHSISVSALSAVALTLVREAPVSKGGVRVRKNGRLRTSMSRNKVLRVDLLLAERFGKGCYSSDDSADHEYERYDGPDNTPTL